MYSNREDAGRKLAAKLLSGHFTADIVVGLARGGVAVSHEISLMLGIPHDVLVVKKIGSPGNPEFAVGAVVPEGQTLDIQNKTVIVTDDGAATGETMTAAVSWVKQHGVKNVIIALPVVPQDVVERLKKMGVVIALHTPVDFGAVGEFYENFEQLTDKDVVELLT